MSVPRASNPVGDQWAGIRTAEWGAERRVAGGENSIQERCPMKAIVVTDKAAGTAGWP
jgi:hypothetical protein